MKIMEKHLNPHRQGHNKRHLQQPRDLILRQDREQLSVVFQKELFRLDFEMWDGIEKQCPFSLFP
jgi:hypothetical protein